MGSTCALTTTRPDFISSTPPCTDRNWPRSLFLMRKTRRFCGRKRSFAFNWQLNGKLRARNTCWMSILIEVKYKLKEIWLRVCVSKTLSTFPSALYLFIYYGCYDLGWSSKEDMELGCPNLCVNADCLFNIKLWRQLLFGHLSPHRYNCTAKTNGCLLDWNLLLIFVGPFLQNVVTF